MFVRARIAALRPRPLRRLSPAAIASGAVALGAAIASDCLLQPMFQGPPLQRGFGAAMAASFGVAGTHWALTREPSEWNALRGCATTGAVVLLWAVFCNPPAVLRAGEPSVGYILLILPVLLVVVAAVGAMAGTLFGLTAIAVIAPVERAGARDALDAPERVLLPASVWLSGWGLLLSLLPPPRSPAPFAVTLLGLAGLAAVALRDLARLRFLTALYGGASPRWQLSRAAPSPRSIDAPAYGPYPESALDGQLLPAPPPVGPYREPPPGDAVARLPLDPSRGRAPVVRRLAWCAALGAIIAVATATRLGAGWLGW